MTEPRKWKAGSGQSIDALYAWVATEPNGGEGLCGGLINDTWTALVGADIDRARSLRPFAEMIHRQSGYPVRLIRFSMREDLDVLP